MYVNFIMYSFRENNFSMLLFIVAILIILKLAIAQEFRCVLEKLDSVEYCVFRNVTLSPNIERTARFSYPDEGDRPSQVAFVDSLMMKLPNNFMTLVGSDLKVLRVDNCNLVSITIPSGLEALYAKHNWIKSVNLPQGGTGASLRILDLSENNLSDVSNITQLQALEELNLSRNIVGEVQDLGNFRGLHKLRTLNLSHSDFYYLDNTDNVNLESLEDLDLSHNNILPSDLNIKIFYPYTKLHTLRLNNNLMSQLDYNFLLKIKSLKTVYLNGNNFKCDYLDLMLNHLQENGLQTPPGETNSCSDKVFKEFCCTGPLPTKPTKSTSSTTKATPIVEPTEPQVGSSTEQPPGGSSSSGTWIAVGVGSAVVVIAVVIGFLFWKKQQNMGSNYQVPVENVEI